MTAIATESNSVNENRRPIYSAVLFSSFPEDIVAKTKDELLTRFGVDVQEILPVDRQRGIKGAMERNQLVFVHHEMSSHSDTGRLKKFAKSIDKECIPISRKSSAWEEQLQYKLHELSPTSKRVIPDERMDAFLHEYVELKGKGFSLSQMLEPLSKYRSSGNFNKNQQVAVVVAKLLKGERAPQWFREWEASFVESTPVPEVASAEGEVIPPNEELAQMSSENADLREKLAELEDQNKSLVEGGKAWASEVLDAVKVLVNKGVISKENGFEMIAKAVGK